jgi:hypothetical protein
LLLTEALGSAIAAFNLAQFAFLHQVATGAMSKGIATKILEQSIEANNVAPILATTSPQESFKLC